MFLPLSLKAMKKMSLGEDKKIGNIPKSHTQDIVNAPELTYSVGTTNIMRSIRLRMERCFPVS